MSERWFFIRDDDVVVLRGRFEADDGTIVDAFKVVRPGEKVFGFSYRKLFSAKAGTLVVGKDGKARIETP